MLKKFTLRKLSIAILMAIVAFILYMFPEPLKEHIEDMQNNKEAIFLIDKNNYVSMIKVVNNGKDTKEKIREIIKTLTIESKNDKIIPNGFKAIIPKNTTLLDYSLEEGMLKLNFSKEFWNVKKDDEEKMIQSIVYSLTEIKEVQKIMIFVEGKQIQKLPKSNKKLDLYLDRNYGINKVYDIKTFNNIDCYTVYFLGKAEEYYYIPVTYFKDNINDKVEIIVESLTTSPTNNEGLISHLDYQVKLMNYEINEDKIDMYFNNYILNNLDKSYLKEEVKYSLVYSLNDTLGVKTVNFLVDNEKIEQFTLEN